MKKSLTTNNSIQAVQSATVGTLEFAKSAIECFSRSYGYATEYARKFLNPSIKKGMRNFTEHLASFGYTLPTGARTIRNNPADYSIDQLGLARLTLSVAEGMRKLSIPAVIVPATVALGVIASEITTTPEKDTKENAGKAKIVKPETMSAKSQLADILSQLQLAAIESENEAILSLVSKAMEILPTI